jgi:hypothetical protein
VRSATTQTIVYASRADVTDWREGINQAGWTVVEEEERHKKGDGPGSKIRIKRQIQSLYRSMLRVLYEAVWLPRCKVQVAREAERGTIVSEHRRRRGRQESDVPTGDGGGDETQVGGRRDKLQGPYRNEGGRIP